MKIIKEFEVYKKLVENTEAMFKVNMNLIDMSLLNKFSEVIEIVCDDDNMEQLITALDEPEISEMQELVGLYIINNKVHCFYYTNNTDDVNEYVINENFEFEYELLIHIDKQWEIYTGFLFPDKYVEVEMTTLKNMNDLNEFGDDSSIKRDVVFTLELFSEKHTKKCMDFLRSCNFNFENIGYEMDMDTYTIAFSNNMNTDIESIREIEHYLLENEEVYNFFYEGWGTKVCKKVS